MYWIRVGLIVFIVLSAVAIIAKLWGTYSNPNAQMTRAFFITSVLFVLVIALRLCVWVANSNYSMLLFGSAPTPEPTPAPTLAPTPARIILFYQTPASLMASVRAYVRAYVPVLVSALASTPHLRGSLTETE